MPKKSNANVKKLVEAQSEEVTLKTIEILGSIDTLKALLTFKIPVLTRFKLIRAFQKLKPLEEAYTETRIAKAKELSGGKMKKTLISNPRVPGEKMEIDEYDIPENKKDLWIKTLGELNSMKQTFSVAKIPLKEFNECNESVGALIADLSSWLIT